MSSTGKPTHIGGQAVLEGVMMRGKRSWAVAARDPQGIIHVEEQPLRSAAAHNAWMRWPLVRGVVSLVESLALGIRALTISARLAGLEDASPAVDAVAVGEEGGGSARSFAAVESDGVSTDETNTARMSEHDILPSAPITADASAESPASALTGGAIAGSMVIGAVMAVGIFILLPAFLTNLMVGSAQERLLLWNLTDGIVRVVLFFVYVAVIGRVPDIKRVFQYHGAEHKVIHAVEHGDPLTPDAARRYPTLHVRCGTAFLIMVMALAILVFSLIPVRAMIAAWGIDNSLAILALVIVSRLILMPLVAGLAYEVTVKWAGPRADTRLVKILLWPGLQMQRLTTAEPDDEMLEVAIASTKRVLTTEQEADEAEAKKQVKAGDEPALIAEYDLLDDAL